MGKFGVDIPPPYKWCFYHARRINLASKSVRKARANKLVIGDLYVSEERKHKMEAKDIIAHARSKTYTDFNRGPKNQMLPKPYIKRRLEETPVWVRTKRTTATLAKVIGYDWHTNWRGNILPNKNSEIPLVEADYFYDAAISVTWQEKLADKIWGPYKVPDLEDIERYPEEYEDINWLVK